MSNTHIVMIWVAVWSCVSVGVCVLLSWGSVRNFLLSFFFFCKACTFCSGRIKL